MVIEIPEDLAGEITRFSEVIHASTEDVILQAVKSYVRGEMYPSIVEPAIKDPEERKRILLSYFGALPDLEDGLEFQHRMRAEWDRDVWK